MSAVTLENWMRPPYNTVAYQRIPELIPTHRIPRGSGEPWELPVASADGLADLAVRHSSGEAGSLPDFLSASYTDAFVAMHRGQIVHEDYRNGMDAGTAHLAMSVSKSITATALARLIDAGQLSPHDQVADVVPEFRDTGLAGATVRHLLDMRTGTREEITTLELQRDYYATVRWAPDTGRRDESSRSHFWRFEQVRPHGGDFEYRSTLTCVLAMLAERVSGLSYAEIVSRDLWEPLGAEYDATVTVDDLGNPLADIGVSCSLRDLARVGELLRLDGSRPDGTSPDGISVVPAARVDDTLRPDADQVDAFQEHGGDFLALPGAYYRNQWWVASPRSTGRDGVYMALGIHGQLLFIDEAAEVVIAKFSSWPEPWVDDVARGTLRACQDIASELADSYKIS